MPSFPWRCLCILLLFKVYGPEITSEKFHRFSEILSTGYCEDKANIETYINETGLIQAVKEYFNFKKQSPSNEKTPTNIYEEPTPGKKGKVNVTNAMSEMLIQIQEEHKKALPGDSANEVRKVKNYRCSIYVQCVLHR